MKKMAWYWQRAIECKMEKSPDCHNNKADAVVLELNVHAEEVDDLKSVQVVERLLAL